MSGGGTGGSEPPPPPALVDGEACTEDARCESGHCDVICCAKGYYMHLTKSGSQGAEGVSYVTTDAVVLSSISVLFADFIIGALMS
jgi:hypothetical protein